MQARLTRRVQVTFHPEAGDHAVQFVKVLTKKEEGGSQAPAPQFGREQQAEAGQRQNHVNAAYQIGGDEGEFGQREDVHRNDRQGTQDEHAERTWTRIQCDFRMKGER